MSLAGHRQHAHDRARRLIVRHGTDEQKQRWLPRMATGELARLPLAVGARRRAATRAHRAARRRRDGDEYVINGTKMWVTNGERAGIVALAARTDEGITCFIVEKEPGPTFGGITVSRRHRQARLQGHRDRRDGLRRPPRPGVDACSAATTGSGTGLGYILGALEVGPHQHRGAGRAAWPGPRSTPRSRYAQERETFGKPIAEHQAIQLKLADMATKLEAARLLTQHAAER